MQSKPDFLISQWSTVVKCIYNHWFHGDILYFLTALFLLWLLVNGWEITLLYCGPQCFFGYSTYSNNWGSIKEKITEFYVLLFLLIHLMDGGVVQGIIFLLYGKLLVMFWQHDIVSRKWWHVWKTLHYGKLTASTSPFNVGVFSMRASKTSSLSFRTYSKTGIAKENVVKFGLTYIYTQIYTCIFSLGFSKLWLDLQWKKK